MGIEMEYVESPLDVLSRAALVVQNEDPDNKETEPSLCNIDDKLHSSQTDFSSKDSEFSENGILGCACVKCKHAREAAQKRSGDSRNHSRSNSGDGGGWGGGEENEERIGEDPPQPCKRARDSPPLPLRPPPPYGQHRAQHSFAAQYHLIQQLIAHGSSNGVAGGSGTVHSTPHSIALSNSSAALSTDSIVSHPNVFSSHHNQHNPHSRPLWQPMSSATRAHAHSSHSNSAHRMESDIDCTSMPLNLTVSNIREASLMPQLPRTTASAPDSAQRAVAALSTSATNMRAQDSNSPGVPETLSGRRVLTQGGLVYYPTPVNGASLPNMEAKTSRDVDSDTCDPAIEEHFRRSLGSAYKAFINGETGNGSSRTPSPPGSGQQTSTAQARAGPGPVDCRGIKLVSVTGTVDEHFAKALGQQTWRQLQGDNDVTGSSRQHVVTTSASSSSSSSNILDVDEHFNRALGADTWLRIKQDLPSSPRLDHPNMPGSHRAPFFHVTPPPTVQ